jgi:hypothetical protein
MHRSSGRNCPDFLPVPLPKDFLLGKTMQLLFQKGMYPIFELGVLFFE